MKYYIFTLAIVILSSKVLAQDPQAILKQSAEKCKAVKSGYYEMTKYRKSMTRKDTLTDVSSCTFKKNGADTLHPLLFHLTSSVPGGSQKVELFSGKDYVNYTTKDSTGRIYSIAKNPDLVKEMLEYANIYAPFKNSKCFPVPSESPKVSVTLAGEESIKNNPCYRVRIIEKPDYDSSDVIHSLKTEYNIWIDKKGLLPVQYSVLSDIVSFADTMYQYEKYVLDKHEPEQVKGESQFQPASVPKYIRLKEYSKEDETPLLPVDTVAPAWSLPSLSGETRSLSDFRGKLVLVDFFYKACYWCMKSYPMLQKLHMKYKDRGLEVIGIDPRDKKEDDVGTFLSKRGVTYTILMAPPELPKLYRVTGYPTMYLIGKDGRILFVQLGYDEEAEAKLEEVIKKNL